MIVVSFASLSAKTCHIVIDFKTFWDDGIIDNSSFLTKELWTRTHLSTTLSGYFSIQTLTLMNRIFRTNFQKDGHFFKVLIVISRTALLSSDIQNGGRGIDRLNWLFQPDRIPAHLDDIEMRVSSIREGGYVCAPLAMAYCTQRRSAMANWHSWFAVLLRGKSDLDIEWIASFPTAKWRSHFCYWSLLC